MSGNEWDEAREQVRGQGMLVNVFVGTVGEDPTVYRLLRRLRDELDAWDHTGHALVVHLTGRVDPDTGRPTDGFTDADTAARRQDYDVARSRVLTTVDELGRHLELQAQREESGVQEVTPEEQARKLDELRRWVDEHRDDDDDDDEDDNA